MTFHVCTENVYLYIEQAQGKLHSGPTRGILLARSRRANFRGFVLPVLEYCSAVWCSAADTHLKLLDRAVSGARFLTGGVFECNISHRRSVAVLCMLYKIRCNPMHPLDGTLSGQYVPARVTRGALVAHRYT